MRRLGMMAVIGLMGLAMVGCESRPKSYMTYDEKMDLAARMGGETREEMEARLAREARARQREEQRQQEALAAQEAQQQAQAINARYWQAQYEKNLHQTREANLSLPPPPSRSSQKPATSQQKARDCYVDIGVVMLGKKRCED